MAHRPTQHPSPRIRPDDWRLTQATAPASSVPAGSAAEATTAEANALLAPGGEHGDDAPPGGDWAATGGTGLRKLGTASRSSTHLPPEVSQDIARREDGSGAQSLQEGEAAVHATTVAVDGRGLLIVGPSGSGKSGLALQLMALGAALVADDITRVSRHDGALWAACPESILGRIEARGIGILAAEPSPPVPLAAAVDLGRSETERLPPERSYDCLGVTIPLILNVPGLFFAASLLQYLKGTRCA